MDEEEETQRIVEDDEEEDVYEEDEGAEHIMLEEPIENDEEIDSGDELVQEKENFEMEEEDEAESNNLEESALEDDDSLVPGTEEDLLSDDSNSLYDEPTGFCDPANIKFPLPGFSDKDQNTIFPLVDEQSGVLFEIVQELETAHFKSSEQALILQKNPVAIPASQLLITDEGPDIKLRIIDSDASEEDSIIQRAVAMASVPEQVNEKLMAAISKDVFPPEKLALLQEALDKGWRREIVMRSNASPGKKLGDVYYFSPEGMKFRSSKQIDLFLSKRPEFGLTVDNFSFAKSRVSYNPEQETVRQAYGGKSPMIVKPVARPPPKPAANFEEVLFGHIENSSRGNNGGQDDSSAARGSSSRRSIQPPKRYATGDNAFHSEKKAKLSTKSQQMKEYMDDGSMEMGMLPPKYPRDMEDSNQTSGLLNDDPMNDFKRRGRPPKPGGRKDMLAQAEAIKAAKSAAGTLHPEEDGALFGISALTQSGHYGHYSEGMNIDYSGNYSQEQCENEEDLEEDANKQQKQEHMGSSDDGLSRNSQVLLPCSIRCPGQTGEIPTLQCRRCLCLYHPGCLGLPNQNYRNFFCSNCEGPNDNTRQPSAASNSRSQQQQQQFSRKIIADKRGMQQSKPLPPLIRVKPSSQNHEFLMRQSSHKMMPRIPNLQPPSSFGRGNPGPGGPRGRMEMVRLHPPSLKNLKRPDAEGRPNSTSSLPTMDMRRIRGRPVRSMLIPQLNNRSSLTITPISIGRKGVNPPPVPRLQPMIPRLGMARRPGGSGVHPGLKALRSPAIGGYGSTNAVPKQLQNPFPRQKIPVHQQQRTHIAQVYQQHHHNQGGRGTSGVPGAQQLKQIGSNNFKRYAQSVVTINQRKYIAVPKSTTVSTALSNQPENGEEQEELTEESAPMDEGEASVVDEYQVFQVDECLQNQQIDDEVQGEPIDEEIQEDQFDQGNQLEGENEDAVDPILIIDHLLENNEEEPSALDSFENEEISQEDLDRYICNCCETPLRYCRHRRDFTWVENWVARGQAVKAQWGVVDEEEVLVINLD